MNAGCFFRCFRARLPALAVVLLLLQSGQCHGSVDNDTVTAVAVTATAATTTTAVTTTAAASEQLSSSWAAAAAVAAVAATAAKGNETAAGAEASAAAGKPSKFDEHVEDWQYVDEPLKNVTAAAGGHNATSAAAAAAPAAVCKICLLAKNKPRRNKRNHDSRLFKMAAKSSRHRELYAELVAAAASKQSYRRKRYRRDARDGDVDVDTVQAADTEAAVDADAAESSTYRQLFRFKRYRRTAAQQLYRRRRFRRSAVAAYPNGVVRPYQYHGNGNAHHHHSAVQSPPHQHQQQQPQYGRSSLAADLQQQQNRRRRYRYAADPYHYRRNSQWDRSAEFRRRYLRFPPTHDAPPPAYGTNHGNGNVNPWSPSVASVVAPPPLSQPQPFSYLPQYPVQQHQPPPPPPPPPAMGPRSPRLVFRDPVDQGTLQAPFGGVGAGGPNGLQDLLVSQPDDVKGQ